MERDGKQEGVGERGRGGGEREKERVKIDGHA